jgi:hypothetical protein
MRALLQRNGAWSGALTVLVITTALVALDIADPPIHRYWSRHPFSSSVLAGLLVLLLTVLVSDRVVRMRALKSQSRAVAAQAAFIVAQAAQVSDAIKAASPSDEERAAAGEALRTYAQMLFTSAPVLIEAKYSRAFLEAAQLTALQMIRAVQGGPQDRRDGGGTREGGEPGAAHGGHDGVSGPPPDSAHDAERDGAARGSHDGGAPDAKKRMAEALAQLRAAATPVLAPLSVEQRAAVMSEETDLSEADAAGTP